MNKCFFKTLPLIFSVLILLTTVFSIGATAVLSDPIPISSKAELNNIRNNLDGSYYLTCDIVFEPSDFAEGGDFYNSGKGFVPIGNPKAAFTGSLDGRGYTISGLQISVSGAVYSTTIIEIKTASVPVVAADGWTGDYIIPSKPVATVSPTVGLIGVNAGVVKNLAVTDATISINATNSYKTYAGIIAGHNIGEISNCAVDGTVSNNGPGYVGGLAGYHSYGTISNSASVVELYTGGTFGGIAGGFSSGTLNSSYTVAISNEQNVSAVGALSDDLEIGAYYIADEELEGFGSRISFADSKLEESYVGFDFDQVWYMDQELELPWLYSLNVFPGDINGSNTVDLEDVVALAQYVAVWDITVKEKRLNVNGDFDSEGNAIINLNDVVHLAQYVAGWENIELH